MELDRHSDHHFLNHQKVCKSLNYHDISPQMPFGYPTSMVVCQFVPATLAFKIMNPRVPEEMKAVD